MHSLYKLLKSVTVGVVLILLLAASSILATLVPQGEDLAFYYHNFSPTTAWLIVNTGFHRFFRSVLFLLPAVLFFINLGVCTVDRIVGRLIRGAKMRYGPDLIHVGLLLLIAGGITTALVRREGFVYMAEGDRIQLTETVWVSLEDYQFHQYEDGRPKDWISTVSVVDDGRPTVEKYAIEVNHPLRYDGLRVFQTSYATEARVEMIAPDGSSYQMRAGQGVRKEDTMLVLAGVDQAAGLAVFEEWKGHQKTASNRVAQGGKVAEYTIGDIRVLDVTGLKVVSDPGFLPVVIAFTMITVGLALTYIQKIGDNKL